MNRTNFPPAVVLINGFPGAGKFTIAQHMVSNHYFGLPDRVRFIDNHLLIDAVEAASPRHLHLPDYDQLRYSQRRIIFDSIKRQPDSVVLITTSLATSARDKAVFGEHTDIARTLKVPAILVNLSCGNLDDHAMRLQDTSRVTKTKLTDPAVLNMMLCDHVLLKIEDCKPEIDGIEVRYIEYDIAGHSVEESAKALFQILRDTVTENPDR